MATDIGVQLLFHALLACCCLDVVGFICLLHSVLAALQQFGMVV